MVEIYRVLFVVAFIALFSFFPEYFIAAIQAMVDGASSVASWANDRMG